ncbi:MAG: hypothetical protein K9M07_03950 [Simkaniaceae bacterium]|nr:hypothetical protein [Simkaniaceae bacterium]MCF7852380.1 hypothetical protein [Simkaniaceae bacterium]
MSVQAFNQLLKTYEEPIRLMSDLTKLIQGGISLYNVVSTFIGFIPTMCTRLETSFVWVVDRASWEEAGVFTAQTNRPLWMNSLTLFAKEKIKETLVSEGIGSGSHLEFKLKDRTFSKTIRYPDNLDTLILEWLDKSNLEESYTIQLTQDKYEFEAGSLKHKKVEHEWTREKGNWGSIAHTYSKTVKSIEKVDVLVQAMLLCSLMKYLETPH